MKMKYAISHMYLSLYLTCIFLNTWDITRVSFLHVINRHVQVDKVASLLEYIE